MEIAGKDNIDAKLLPYKRRLAYIESFRTQCIDTGITAKAGLAYDFVFEYSNYEAGSVFGAYDGNVFVQINTVYFMLNTDVGAVLGSLAMRKKHEIHLGQDSFTVNGIPKQYNKGMLDCNSQVMLFTRSDRGKIDNGQFAGIRMYSFKVSDESDTIMNLVPVMSLGDEPCMYDKVSKQLFRNVGTGTFGYDEIRDNSLSKEVV